jgi:hypothetical protein
VTETALPKDDAPLPMNANNKLGTQRSVGTVLAAVEGRSQALEPPPRPFIGVPPRIASFTGRSDELDRLDAILMHDKPAAVTQASVGRAAVQRMGGVGKTSLAIEYARCATAAATPWRTPATTPGRCKPTSATRTFSTR